MEQEQKKVPKPLTLIILDGWGYREHKEGNACVLARTPNLTQLNEEYPATTLTAHGEAVGLPEGQMGNSEVGHLNIGAGRVVYQELTRITKAIREGDFYTNPVFLEALKETRDNQKALHLMGLLSDGGVHSHINHLFALLEMAKKQGLTKVFVHCFLDGRDVPPKNAKEYIVALENKLKELGLGAIATVMGRYYAMDRDRRWERVERAYNAMTFGQGHNVTLPVAAVDQSYDRDENDEFVQPTVVINKEGNPVATVQDGDAIIFYNFRPDRAREITRAFIDVDFTGFERQKGFPKVNFVCMTQYDKTIQAPVAFGPQVLDNTLGIVLSKQGLKQLRIAETEKYAHVTFFFNGGIENPNEGEDRVLIPSPKVATYDLKPEMSANEVTEEVVKQVNSDQYDVIILNLANPDMVGHTGILEAAIQAMEVVDKCVGQITAAVLAKGGAALITADHGNCDEMADPETGQPFTAHSLSDVKLLLVDNTRKGLKINPGSLQDIAPTMLKMLGIQQPVEMTGKALV